MAQITLAKALLRRKELQGIVDRLKLVNEKALYEVKATRRNVTENIDDIIAQIPKLSASQVMREYNWHARQLREIDAVIQQTNWTTQVEVADEAMRDYTEPAPDKAAA